MNKMENLERPDFSSEIHKKQLKLTLLNTRKSATFGIFLIITPFLMLIGVLFKYYLGMHPSIFTAFFEWLTSIDPDNDSSLVSWLIRFLILGGPIIAVIINLLSIVHFQYDGQIKEVLISIKIKWLNITIAAVCLFILMIFFFYLLVENINHP